jgi:hypothetical protein
MVAGCRGCVPQAVGCRGCVRWAAGCHGNSRWVAGCRDGKWIEDSSLETCASGAVETLDDRRAEADCDDGDDGEEHCLDHSRCDRRMVLQD